MPYRSPPLNRALIAAVVVSGFAASARAHEVWVDLNTYVKDRQGNAAAVGRTQAFAGADGVWLITQNAYGDSNNNNVNNPQGRWSGIDSTGSTGFNLGDWQTILRNIAGPTARVATEDNPAPPIARTDQSYRDFKQIASGTGFTLTDSLQYHETGASPGGTILSDDDINLYAGNAQDTAPYGHGGKIAILTRSYNSAAWIAPTEHALANPKVSAVVVETIDIEGQQIANLLKSALAPRAATANDAARGAKPVYLLLNRDAFRNVPQLYHLKQQAPGQMASDLVRLVMTNNYTQSNTPPVGTDGYGFYGPGDTLEGQFRFAQVMKTAVPVETWKWQTAGQASNLNWSTKSNWTVGPIAMPLVAGNVGGTVQQNPSQYWDAANFTSSTLTGDVNIALDVSTARVLAMYYDGAANYKISGPQTLTLTAYGTVGADGRVPFAAGAIPTAVASDSDSYAPNVVPIQIKGTGKQTINANILIDATRAAGVIVDQQNVTNPFTAGGTVNLAFLPAAVTGPGETVFSGNVNNGKTLTKTGAGKLTLNAAASFNAGVSLNGGMLALNGTLATTTVTVASGATLAGSGVVNGSVLASGTVAPGGDSPGTLSVNGDVSIATGGTLAFDRTATANDRLALSGKLTLAGELALASTAELAVGQSVTLITNAGSQAVSGTFANAPGGLYVDAAGRGYTVNYSANTDGTANDVTLTRVAVPEPAALSLVGVAGAAVLRRTRRH